MTARLTFVVVEPDGVLRVVEHDQTHWSTLSALQSAVGGWLELVPTATRDLVAYVDEDGLRLNRPANPVGTLVLAALGSRARHAAGVLLGPLVLVGSRGPSEVSLTADQLDLIRGAHLAALAELSAR
jgi:hypothetical protein